MSTEPHQQSHEEQLCTSCTASNETSANFCVKCGAPLSSFSMIAPFERLFAEGFIYRQAANHPRRLITVFGVWFMFGATALGCMIMMVAACESANGGLVAAVVVVVLGAAVLTVSLAMIWKSTRNYLARNEIDPKTDAS